MKPYGSGRTKASHYKPLSGYAAEVVRKAKQRAAREKPLPLPAADLGPAKTAPDPAKKLEPQLLTAGADLRRDRNW